MKESYKDVDVSIMVVMLWMRTALRFVVECVRNLTARIPQLVFSVTFPERVFWVLLPALVLIKKRHNRKIFLIVCIFIS